MDIFQALILSVVEGITEFLPVSSTGHQVLAAAIFHIAETDLVKNFEIIIQLGAILAIVVLYWRTLIKSLEIWKRIIVAFIPTGIVGLVLFKIIKNYLLGNDWITVLALLIGGILLIAIEYMHTEKEHHVEDIEKMSLKNAFLIGVAQSLSIIPGVSRSAATILGAMVLGTKRQTAVEFSFLLAVPTMLAATGLDVLDMLKHHTHFSVSDFGIIGFGFIIAFVVAMVTVKYFLQYVKSHTFVPFGVYRIIIAIVFWFIFLR